MKSRVFSCLYCGFLSLLLNCLVLNCGWPSLIPQFDFCSSLSFPPLPGMRWTTSPIFFGHHKPLGKKESYNPIHLQSEVLEWIKLLERGILDGSPAKQSTLSNLILGMNKCDFSSLGL